jgi:two-component sensor histidine kinase
LHHKGIWRGFPPKGAIIRRILRTRLPERFAGRLPPPLVELTVGVVIAVALLGLRIALVPLAGDRAPYAFVFLGIVIACLLAGWRSGLVALLVGQVLTWMLVVDGIIRLGAPRDVRVGGLAIAAVSQLIVLVIIALYQREVAKGLREQDRRMELLEQARGEIEHRARNNVQTVLSLIQLQTTREKDPNVKAALQHVTKRISAISIATDHLAIRSNDMATVRLRYHLCELCQQLERGLAQGDVRVECDIPDVTASADTAIHLALIVNELVTNALKHAFEEGRSGVVRVHSKMVDGGLELKVSDDGRGMKARSPAPGGGLGRKLVDNFAQHLNAKQEVSTSTEGTTYKILVPALV